MPGDIEQQNNNNCLTKHKSSSVSILNFKKEKISETNNIRKLLSKKNDPKFDCFAYKRKAKAKNMVREKSK